VAGRRRDSKGQRIDPWERPWGEGRGRSHGRRHQRPWPEPGAPPEVVAERFAEAVEDVAGKVGTALERAFDDSTEDGAKRRQKVEEVGERVATAVEQAIGKVGEALPRPDPFKSEKKLLKRRDQANNQTILFAFLWIGISFAVLWGGGINALPAVVVLGAVFGALVTRNVLWKRNNRGAIGHAETALSGVWAGEGDPEAEPEAEPEPEGERSDWSDTSVSAEAETEAESEQSSDDDLMSKLRIRETTVSEFVGAVDRQALQVLSLLKELGEDRPEIRRSVDLSVAKCNELDHRRDKLEALLEDPDLAALDDRIADLEVRIEETRDEATRVIYQDTLGQLRSQSESLADVRVMIERLDAYINSSLQSLRTIHIDLLRLQTGDLDDPTRALEEISTRASNLNIETKSVREVVEEVDRARRAAGRGTQRQL